MASHQSTSDHAGDNSQPQAGRGPPSYAHETRQRTQPRYISSTTLGNNVKINQGDIFSNYTHSEPAAEHHQGPRTSFNQFGGSSRSGLNDVARIYGPEPQSAARSGSISSTHLRENSQIHQGDVVNNYAIEAHRACHVIPFDRNEDVIERPGITRELQRLVPHAGSESNSAALWGLGGSGKTQIALQYAYLRTSRYPGCSVFWVHADSRTSFVNDYKTIAQRFGLDGLDWSNDEVDNEAWLMNVRYRMESYPHWLVIIDNADNLQLFGVSDQAGDLKSLRDYLPRGPGGTVLWTSRDENIAGSLVGLSRAVQVDKMTHDEGKALLQYTRARAFTNEELISMDWLLEELTFLPLAIIQAGVYMRRTQTSTADYNSRLIQSRPRQILLDNTPFDRHRRPEVSNSVLETLCLSIDQIETENPIAWKILHIIAYFNNEDIPVEVIEAAGKIKRRHVDMEELTLAIKRLQDFSFIRLRKTGQPQEGYEMHKLVQKAARLNLFLRGTSEDDYESGSANTALKILLKLFPNHEVGNWLQCKRYMAHANHVADLTQAGEERIGVAHLLERASRYLFESGRWEENLKLDERVLQIRQEALGAEHVDTTRTRLSLAATYLKLCRFESADLHANDCFKIRYQALGLNHPDTVESMAILATVQHEKKLYGEAVKIWDHVIPRQSASYGPESELTTSSMVQLAEAYGAQEKYEDARELTTKALNIQERTLGKRHRRTIKTTAQLAAILQKLNHVDEAMKLRQSVLEQETQILGEEHPDRLQTLHDFAVDVYNQGDHERAAKMMKDCIGLRCKMLGTVHPLSKDSKSRLLDWTGEREGQTLVVGGRGTEEQGQENG